MLCQAVVELLLITANFSLNKLLISVLCDEAINQTRTGESGGGWQKRVSKGGRGEGRERVKEKVKERVMEEVRERAWDGLRIEGESEG